MRRSNRTLRRQQGSVYILALLVLLILTIVGLAVSLVTQSEMQIGVNERLGHQAFHVRRFAHIGGDAERVDALRAQLGLRLPQRLFAAGADRDAAALRGEGERNRAADAAAAARDDRCFVAQSEFHGYVWRYTSL